MPLGKFSVEEHLVLTFSFELLWYMNHSSYPKYSPPVLTFSSPRLVKPRIPAAIRSDTDLCHQDRGLGKDAFRPAEQSLNSHSLN